MATSTTTPAVTATSSSNSIIKREHVAFYTYTFNSVELHHATSSTATLNSIELRHVATNPKPRTRLPRKEIKCKGYSPQALVEAVGRVKSKELTMAAASRLYKIPEGTLWDHCKGRVFTGHQYQISPQQETALADYCVYLNANNSPLDRKGLKAKVVELIRREGEEAIRKCRFNLQKGPSTHWLQRFERRHPEIKYSSEEASDFLRTRMTPGTLDGVKAEMISSHQNPGVKAVMILPHQNPANIKITAIPPSTTTPSPHPVKSIQSLPPPLRETFPVISSTPLTQCTNIQITNKRSRPKSSTETSTVQRKRSRRNTTRTADSDTDSETQDGITSDSDIDSEAVIADSDIDCETVTADRDNDFDTQTGVTFDSDVDYQSICAICLEEDPASQVEEVKWISCDVCQRWCHYTCEKLPSDFKCTGHYICTRCQSSLFHR